MANNRMMPSTPRHTSDMKMLHSVKMTPDSFTSTRKTTYDSQMASSKADTALGKNKPPRTT